MSIPYASHVGKETASMRGGGVCQLCGWDELFNPSEPQFPHRSDEITNSCLWPLAGATCVRARCTGARSGTGPGLPCSPRLPTAPTAALRHAPGAWPHFCSHSRTPTLHLALPVSTPRSLKPAKDASPPRPPCLSQSSVSRPGPDLVQRFPTFLGLSPHYLPLMLNPTMM